MNTQKNRVIGGNARLAQEFQPHNTLTIFVEVNHHSGTVISVSTYPVISREVREVLVHELVEQKCEDLIENKRMIMEEINTLLAFNGCKAVAVAVGDLIDRMKTVLEAESVKAGE